MKRIVVVMPAGNGDDELTKFCIDAWKLEFDVSVISAQPRLMSTQDTGYLGSEVYGGCIDSDKFDGIAIMGGNEVAQSLWRCPQLVTTLQEFDTAKKLTAGVGTGSLMLAEAGLLVGKRATTFRDDRVIAALRSLGAIYDASEVVVLAWIITADGARLDRFSSAVASFLRNH